MDGLLSPKPTTQLTSAQDYDLSAVFMRNWDTRDESGTDKGCEWEKDWEDVQRVCRMIDLPCEMVCLLALHLVIMEVLTRLLRKIDLSREYWNRVFQPNLRVWETGLTPNPDVWCNRSAASS